MGFKEGITVLGFVALLIFILPRIFPGAFGAEIGLFEALGPSGSVLLAVTILFYVLDSFLNKSNVGSSGYLPTEVVRGVTNFGLQSKEIGFKSKALNVRSPQTAPPRSRPTSGPYRAGSFGFRRFKR